MILVRLHIFNRRRALAHSPLIHVRVHILLPPQGAAASKVPASGKKEDYGESGADAYSHGSAC